MALAQRERMVGRPTHDDPKAPWRAYQPANRSDVPPRRSAMDYESMATTMEADPLEQSQIDKARLTVAHQARKKFPEDIAAAGKWAKQTMLMLGIHESQKDDIVPTLDPNALSSANN